MGKKLKSNIIYSLGCTILFIMGLLSTPNHAAADQIGLNAESAILVDANSGKILYESNADLLLPPASMTKMMTEYLVLEAINEGKISWDTETPISQFVYDISQKRNLSNVPLRQDGKYTVRELYEAMAIYSANGATIALTELIAGSETEFVKMMNEKAEELDLKDYKLVNSTGLNNKDLLGNHPGGTNEDDENYLSARATAKLAYHLINDFPEVLETASIPKKVFREGTSDAINMPNWNWMLPGMEGYLEAFSYEGMDGIKTGSTNLAGYCFTGTAERNGMRLISVVMRTDSRTARFEETRKLMDYGFNNFEQEQLFDANYQIEGESVIPVEKGKEKEVGIASKEPVSVIIKSGEEDLYQAKYVIDESALNEEGAIVAPIEKGTKVGEMQVEYTGEDNYGYITSGETNQTVDVVTTSAVEKSNWFVLMMRGIGGFFSDIWTSVADMVKGLF